MKTISFFSFLNSKQNLLVIIKIPKVIISAIKNRKNTNNVASTNFNPIFIAGKEVPQRIAAKTVKRIALIFLFNNIALKHHS